jgi:hypothetical protein
MEYCWLRGLFELEIPLTPQLPISINDFLSRICVKRCLLSKLVAKISHHGNKGLLLWPRGDGGIFSAAWALETYTCPGRRLSVDHPRGCHQQGPNKSRMLTGQRDHKFVAASWAWYCVWLVVRILSAWSNTVTEEDTNALGLWIWRGCQYSVYLHLVTILNPVSFISCSVCFWVKLKAGK